MTEIDDIVPSGTYLSAKVNRSGETFLITGFAAEKSRFKEGQTNLVLILTDNEGEEKKVTLNKQSRENIANAYGRTLEVWVGKAISIAYLRPTAVGTTIDFLPAPTFTTPPPTTEKNRTQQALDVLRGYGEKGAPVKGFNTALQDRLKISAEGADAIITALKNEGWVIEDKNKIREA